MLVIKCGMDKATESFKENRIKFGCDKDKRCTSCGLLTIKSEAQK